MAIQNTQQVGGSPNVSSETSSTSFDFSNIVSKLSKNNLYSGIGNTMDSLSSLLPSKGMEGKHSALAAGLQTAQERASDAIMQVNPVAGMIVKAGLFADKGLKNLGGYTDNQTVQDAIMSAIPIFGNINGWAGRKADTMSRDYDTWARAGNSYTGAESFNENTMLNQGKKYGLLSRGALKRANMGIHKAGRQQNVLSDIMGYNADRMESLMNQQDMNNKAYMNTVFGGYDQSAVYAAKRGGIITPKMYQLAHKVAYNYMKTHQPNIDDELITEDDINNLPKFQNGGQMNLLPTGALHAHKHHITDNNPDLKGQITEKGIPVVSLENGEQCAEIETNEILLNKELTDKIEELRDLYKNAETQKEKDEIAREAGELLSNDIIENTQDEGKFIKSIE